MIRGSFPFHSALALAAAMTVSRQVDFLTDVMTSANQMTNGPVNPNNHTKKKKRNHNGETAFQARLKASTQRQLTK